MLVSITCAVAILPLHLECTSSSNCMQEDVQTQLGKEVEAKSERIAMLQATNTQQANRVSAIVCLQAT